MAFFDWTSKFETGISEIDFQHRNLVNMVNNLADASKDSEGAARDMIVRITLEQLIDYTVYHFTAEEALMQQASYEHIAEHKKAHEALKKAAVEINGRLEKGEDVLPQLMDFLKAWLEKHILGMDMEYVPAMKKAGVSKI
jgi:hemerythrin